MRTSHRAHSRTMLGVIALAAGAACAEKAFTPVDVVHGGRVALQVTASAAQQVSLSPRYIWIGAAALIPGGDTSLMAMANAPVTGSSQTITLNIDISSCVAATAAKGGSGCRMIVAAALRADSLSSPTDTTDFDPFLRAYDIVIAGPYDVGSGRAPTIPPIDLSASRFAVVGWAQDGALQLGGAVHAVGSNTPTGRVLAGTVSAGGNPTLYTVTRAFDYASFNPTQPQPPQLYPTLAVFENGTWRRVLATNTPALNTAVPISNQGFMDVTALATNDVYIAAASGLYKFDGTVFSKISAVTDSLFSVASAPTAGGGRVVIAGGTSGVVWIGYGTSWQRYVASGSTARFDGVCITGASEAFASSSASGALYRFNGTSWTAVPTPLSGPKNDLQCPGPGQAYVLVSGLTNYRWSAGGWAQLPTPGLTVARQLRLGVVSANEIYAAGDSGSTDRAFYKFDGTSWTEITRRISTGPVRLWADPRGGAAYIHSSFGRLDKITPSSVVTMSYQPALRDVAVNATNSAFAVGGNLFLARWDGARWAVDAPPKGTQSTRTLHGVWSDGASNAWAVGETSLILRYGGTGWSVVSDVNRPIAGSDGYNAVWGSGSDVWIAGENNIVRCRSVSACTVETSGGGALYSVWGSSATNVFAVGAGGRILRNTGTGWVAMGSPTTRALARVAGSGPSDVWAFGDSVLVHFDGTQWTNIPYTDRLLSARSRVPWAQLPGTFQLGLWVRSPKEVYLGGDNGVILRWDGNGWQTMMQGRFAGRRILSISGAAGCVVAVTEGLSDVVQPTLWRGLGTNGCNASAMGAPSSWP